MSELKVSGIGRVGGNEEALCLYFNRKPTDDEMRKLHKIIRACCLRLSYDIAKTESRS